jgi:hypothetical protein
LSNVFEANAVICTDVPLLGILGALGLSQLESKEKVEMEDSDVFTTQKSLTIDVV